MKLDGVQTLMGVVSLGALALFLAVTIAWPLLCLLWNVIVSAWRTFDASEESDAAAFMRVVQLRSWDGIRFPEGTEFSSDGRYAIVPGGSLPDTEPREPPSLYLPLRQAADHLISPDQVFAAETGEDTRREIARMFGVKLDHLRSGGA
ncbi:hypothetical protein [Hyphomonas sp.]|uniref:hypothetical protein n=1 Tax=Hyphomonas sp. TaxID=87 RepID=UPI0025BF206B|nr:hypothetical protein [Hyphomonas sp.]